MHQLTRMITLAFVLVRRRRYLTLSIAAALLVAGYLIGTVQFAIASPSQDSATWTKLRARWTGAQLVRQALLFDADANQLLLLASDYSWIELWSMSLESDSEVWQKTKMDGPLPRGRRAPAVVMDERRRQLIVFGGQTQINNTPVNETWVLDLAASPPAWREIAVENPPPGRVHASLTIVPSDISGRDRDVLVLFGGNKCPRWASSKCSFGSKIFGDTWILELEPGNERWREVSTCGTPPLPRSGHSAVFDRKNNQMLVFGGLGGSVKDDLWSLDMTPGSECWSEIRPGGARVPEMDGPIAGFDRCAGAERMVLVNPGRPKDVWVLSRAQGSNEEWHKQDVSGVSPPQAGRSKGLPFAYDYVARRMAVLYAANTYMLDLGQCDAPTPTPTATSEPTASATASATATESPTVGPTPLRPTATATPTEESVRPIYLPRLYRDPPE